MTTKELFQKKCLIGMVHLLPLPGTLNYTGEIDAIYSQAIADAKALEEGGASALIVENMNDVPAPLTLSAEQFAFLAALLAVFEPQEIQRDSAFLQFLVNVLIIRHFVFRVCALAREQQLRQLSVGQVFRQRITDPFFFGDIQHLNNRRSGAV